MEANKCEERAVTSKWPPLLVTSLHWSHHVDRKALVTRGGVRKLVEIPEGWGGYFCVQK